MSRPTGSTLDAQAELERTNELRAATAELAARKVKADADLLKAEADLKAASQPATPTVVVVPAVIMPSWTPADNMGSDAVRLAVASYFRDVLTVIRDDEADLGLLRSITYAFEPMQLDTLVNAMEKGAGIKAAPRHTVDCLETREWQASRNKPLVCLAGCPMLSVRAPSAPKAAPAAGDKPATDAKAPSHSLGNVEYHGPNAAEPVLDITCAEAAKLAAADYADAQQCIAHVATKLKGGNSNARSALKSDILNKRVPEITFGMAFLASLTVEDEAAAVEPKAA